VDYLRRKYKFNELDLKDAYADKYAQRPKFYVRNGYSFLILQFPVYNTKTRAIEAEEIDFFIGHNYIITMHKNNLPPLVELFGLCSGDSFYREQYFSSIHSLLYEIISNLQEYCHPIMDHVSLDIKTIEKSIFTGLERKMVTEILYIKRNILAFRKIMQAHKNVIQKLSREKMLAAPLDKGHITLNTPAKSRVGIWNEEKSKIYFSDLIERTKDIWDNLGEQKEMIEALEDTNSSLVSFKLNDIMRTLTIFSVIILPLSFLAGVFGMNTVHAMPFMNDPFGFWMIIMIMLLVSLLMILFFKRKKWL
jgi:magnesium transporter